MNRGVLFKKVTSVVAAATMAFTTLAFNATAEEQTFKYFGVEYTYEVIENAKEHYSYVKDFPYDECIAITGVNGDPSFMNIPEEIDGLPVADISYAFTELSVEEVMLPDCIVVAEYAFAWCNSLETINYPESLKFGDSFIGFSSVTDITVPDGVTFIPDYTFSKAKNLESVTLPDSLTSIGESCFSETNLSEIDIPENVEKIGSYAFSKTNISEIDIPEKMMNATAFKNAFLAGTKIKSFTTPEFMTTIPGDFFKDCTELEEVKYEGEITSIGAFAFYNTKISDIDSVLTDSVKSVGESAFGKNNLGDFTLKYVEGRSWGRDIFEEATLGDVIIEEGYKTVPSGMFDSSTITSVVIPDTVTTIDSSAFNSCKNLKSVKMPSGENSSYSVRRYTFEDCISLESIDLSKASMLDDYSFYNCKKLSEVILPDNVPKTPSIAGPFTGTTSWKYADLPDAWTYIPARFFEHTGIEEMVLHDGLTSIGECAFVSAAIKSIDLPDTVKTIGNNCFLSSQLETIDFSDSMTSIPYGCFNDTNLKSVVIPENITTIGGGAFMNCEQLEELIYHDGVTVMANRQAYYATNLKNLYLPNNENIQNMDKAFDGLMGRHKTHLNIYGPSCYADDAVKTLGNADYTYICTDVDGTFIAGAVQRLPYNFIYKTNVPATYNYKVISGEVPEDLVITIGIPEILGLVEGTVYVNGEKVEYTATDYEITIPVTEVSGKIDLLFVNKGDLSSNSRMSSYIIADYTDTDGTAVNKTLDHIIHDFDAISLDTGNVIAIRENEFDITGKTAPNTEVDVFVDNEYVKTIKSNAVGTFKTDMSTTGSAAEIVVAVKDTNYTDKATILRSLDEIVFEEVKAKHNYTIVSHRNSYETDLVNGIDIFIYYNCSEELIWSIKVDNPEYIDEMYLHTDINITKSNNVFEFVYNSENGYYEATIDDAAFHKFINDGAKKFYISYNLSDEGKTATGLETDAFFVNNIPARLSWIIDPSGIVYEGVMSNPIEGVTATAYWIPYVDGVSDATFWDAPNEADAILWDAEDYDQLNPFITSSSGYYGWDVPAGWWQIKFEKDGYETQTTEWMTVPPIRTDVNINLVKTALAKVVDATAENGVVALEFDQYITPDTIENVKIYGKNDVELDYTVEYATDETDAEGNVYAKKFTLTLTDDETIYSVVVDDTVLNYAGNSVEEYVLDMEIDDEPAEDNEDVVPPAEDDSDKKPSGEDADKKPSGEDADKNPDTGLVEPIVASALILFTLIAVVNIIKKRENN